MKKISLLVGPALLLALFVVGCETDNYSARVQEKSAVYASLKPWQKKYIDKGTIAVGFTPDMVYMAIGNASVVKHDESSGSAHTELWTYRNYYLRNDSSYAPYNPDSPYQPSRTEGVMGDFDGGTSAHAKQVPRGMAQGGTSQSISTTGGVQGGSGEPADLQSYTLYVLFVEGKVVKFGVKAD